MKIGHGSKVERGRSLGGQLALSIAGTVAQARTLPQPKGIRAVPRDSAARSCRGFWLHKVLSAAICMDRAIPFVSKPAGRQEHSGGGDAYPTLHGMTDRLSKRDKSTLLVQRQPLARSTVVFEVSNADSSMRVEGTHGRQHELAAAVFRCPRSRGGAEKVVC